MFRGWIEVNGRRCGEVTAFPPSSFDPPPFLRLPLPPRLLKQINPNIFCRLLSYRGTPKMTSSVFPYTFLRKVLKVEDHPKRSHHPDGCHRYPGPVSYVHDRPGDQTPVKDRKKSQTTIKFTRRTDTPIVSV